MVTKLADVGETNIVIDMSKLEDFSHDQFIWVFDSFEELAKSGGSLSMIVENERVRARFSAVGSDNFVRLFESMDKFKHSLLAEDAMSVYSLAERRPELWKAVKASKESDPIKAIELYDSMTTGAGLQDDPDEREFFVNYIASQMTAKMARLISEEKYTTAKIMLKKMLNAFPDYPPAVLYKGQLHLVQKEYREAAECFSSALEANPDFLPALEGRGSANYYQNLQEKAMEDFTMALKLNPNSQLACYNIACVYASKGEAETALHWLTRAVEQGFNDPDHIENDKDLSPLSSNPEFSSLIQRLRSAAEAPEIDVKNGDAVN